MASTSHQPPAAPSTSQTHTIVTQTQTETQAPRILRLRGAHEATGRSVQWRDDVVDNEGLGRKKSKVCCIYHKPKGVDESSDDSSSSSSDSDSDSGEEAGAGRRERAGGKEKGKGKGHDCRHEHTDRAAGRDAGTSRRRRRDVSPNAYEKMPKYKPKDGDGGKKGHAKGGTGPQAQR